MKNFNYCLNGVSLTRVNSIRDLGVTLDSKLSFNLHIENIVAKAFQQLGFILRVGKPFKRANTYKVLYNSYVRSILEFGSVVWNPQYATHIKGLERVQHKFLKQLDYRTGRFFTSYEEAGTYHDMVTLENRRIVRDSMFFYKLLNNMIDSSVLLENVSLRVPSRVFRHKTLFQIPFSTTRYIQNTFFRRSADTYNRLFLDVDVFYLSLKIYKRRILEIIARSNST